MFTTKKKIKRDRGAEPTEFEETVPQALFDLENTNQELKSDLKDLFINAAVQMDASGNRKAVDSPPPIVAPDSPIASCIPDVIAPVPVPSVAPESASASPPLLFVTSISGLDGLVEGSPIIANIAPERSQRIPSFRLDLSTLGTRGFQALGISDPLSRDQPTGRLAARMFGSPEVEKELSQLPADVLDMHLLNDALANFRMMHYYLEAHRGKTRDSDGRLDAALSKVKELTRLNTRVSSELRGCRADLLREKTKGKAQIESLEADLAAVRAELVAADKRNLLLREEISSRDADLTKVPSRIRWWKKRAMRAFTVGFTNYYRSGSFNPDMIADYASEKMKEIDESEEGFFSSSEEGEGNGGDDRMSS